MRVGIWVFLAMIPVTACDQITAAGTCGSPQPYTAGVAQSGTLDKGDCTTQGVTYDAYLMTLTAGMALQFTVTPNAGLSVFRGVTVPTDLDSDILTIDPGDNPKGFLAAGPYIILVGSDGESGAYTFNSPSTQHTPGCNENRAMPGVIINGTITSDDCAGNAAARQDVYMVNLLAGQSIAVTVSVSRPGALVLTKDGSSTELASKPIQTPGGGTASFTYTATSRGLYAIHVFGEPGTFGPSGYGLTIQ